MAGVFIIITRGGGVPTYRLVLSSRPGPRGLFGSRCSCIVLLDTRVCTVVTIPGEYTTLCVRCGQRANFK